jgi:hypothetical protein
MGKLKVPVSLFKTPQLQQRQPKPLLCTGMRRFQAQGTAERLFGSSQLVKRQAPIAQ